MIDLTEEARGHIDSTARIMHGAYVAPGVRVGKRASIGPNAAILAAPPEHPDATYIAAGADIGANATIIGGVTIGAGARVVPGAVVSRSVPPLAIVEGHPARITGYVRTQEGHRLLPTVPHLSQEGVHETSVSGVSLHHFKQVTDMRGSLAVADFANDVPFSPKRYFMVFDVPSSETRGEHAHRQCHQFLVAVNGQVSVVADDGVHREEFLLDRPNVGLFLPALTWGIQYRYHASSILLVFASEPYSAEDYIRDYHEFLRVKRGSDTFDSDDETVPFTT